MTKLFSDDDDKVPNELDGTTYSAIYAAAEINPEVVLNFCPYNVKEIRSKLELYNSKMEMQINQEGHTKLSRQFVFTERESEDLPGYVELTVILKKTLK